MRVGGPVRVGSARWAGVVDNGTVGSSGEARFARESAARRSQPPEATLQWLLSELGATAVVSCDVMPGGSTSAMHRVTVRTSADATTTVVLRRYVLESYLANEPAA